MFAAKKHSEIYPVIEKHTEETDREDDLRETDCIKQDRSKQSCSQHNKMENKPIAKKGDHLLAEKTEKTRFGQFAEKITLHGVPQIVNSKTQKGKMTWAFMFIVFIAVLCAMLQNVFKSYVANEIYTVREKIQVDKMTFPSVSFCPTAYVHSESSDEQQKNVNLTFNASKNKEHLVDLNKLRMENVLSQRSAIKDIGKAGDDTLFVKSMPGWCKFGVNHSCMYNQDFEKVPVSIVEGSCYKFNPKGRLVQNGEGSYHGLTAKLFLNQTNSDPYTGFLMGPGVMIVIHSHDNFPFPLENGIFVSPGTHTSIVVSKQIVGRLPPPYPSKCSNQGAIIYPGAYTTRNCKRSCFLRYAAKFCSGTEQLMNYYSGKKQYPSLNKTDLLCIYKKQIEAAWLENAKKCKCPLQCHEESFFPTVSHSIWPSHNDLPLYEKIFASALGMNLSAITDEYIHKNFLQITIFFSELAYEKVSEKREWTGQKLISDIGGQMGLWIGASIFSIIELLICLVLFVKNGCR
eukprot:Seg16.3 transcript_id=Seg16.3/GoldUCD/mRNA.D3Y31 product="Acid-sensing ion channel 2" protein_id=Seg16.3/GoldUCD/D3Y31